MLAHAANRETTVFKRSVVIGNKNTSLSLEDVFWDALKNMTQKRGMTISDFVAEIDARRNAGSLSSAVRVYLFKLYRDEMLRLAQ